MPTMRVLHVCVAVGLLALASVPHCVQGKVALMALVHRHGDRSPVDFMPADTVNNAYWPEGPGQLTPTGMQQLHRLGVSLRARYIDDMGLIPGTYSHRHLHYRSTDIDRTLVSAQSVLQGMYPPGTGPRDDQGRPGLTDDVLQAVPIHTVPKDHDVLLRAYNKGACPRFGQLRAERESNELWQTKRRENAHFVDTVAALAGYDELDIGEMWKIHDPLVCDRAHNLTWPPGFTQAIYDRSAVLANFSLTQMFTGTQQRRLSSGVFIEEIRQRLKAGADGAPQPGWSKIIVPGAPYRTGDLLGPRMWMYSAHDTTVSAVLSGLDLFNKHNPPYGSSVVFELHDRSDEALPAGTERWAVRMYFNQGVYHLWEDGNIISLRECTDLCPLSRFLELTEPMGLTDPEEACKLDEGDPDEELEEEGEEFVAVVVALFVLSLLAIVVFAVVKAFRSKPSHNHQRLGDTLEGGFDHGGHDLEAQSPRDPALSASHEADAAVDGDIGTGTGFVGTEAGATMAGPDSAFAIGDSEDEDSDDDDTGGAHGTSGIELVVKADGTGAEA